MLLSAASIVLPMTVTHARSFKTRWKVGWQQGLDACLLLGVLSTPSLQSEAYPEECRYWQGRLSPTGKDALARVRKAIDRQGGLLGPTLALWASATRSDSIEATRAAFAAPEAIRTKLSTTEFWGSAEEWKTKAAYFPDVAAVLAELATQGFSDYWNAKKKPLVETKVVRLRRELSQIDLIGAQQRYVGRPLDPVIGQRFLTSFDYPSIIVKRNAAHEIFHPVLVAARPETPRIVARLSQEPILKRIDARADKSDGYRTITGLVEEGMTQALENLVSRQLGFGRDNLGTYWREQDGGIHVFAAAAFDAMVQSGFAASGGDALSWLDLQSANGNLRADKLARHAEAIIGSEALQKWLS
jgi:hypothetical protein